MKRDLSNPLAPTFPKRKERRVHKKAGYDVRASVSPIERKKVKEIANPLPRKGSSRKTTKEERKSTYGLHGVRKKTTTTTVKEPFMKTKKTKKISYSIKSPKIKK